MIQSKTLADEVDSIYSSDKEFAYDHMFHHKVIPFMKGTDTRLNIIVNAQRRSMKDVLLFLEQYFLSTRDSEKYIF